MVEASEMRTVQKRYPTAGVQKTFSVFNNGQCQVELQDSNIVADNNKGVVVNREGAYRSSDLQCNEGRTRVAILPAISRYHTKAISRLDRPRHDVR